MATLYGAFSSALHTEDAQLSSKPSVIGPVVIIQQRPAQDSATNIARDQIDQARGLRYQQGSLTEAYQDVKSRSLSNSIDYVALAVL